MRLRLFSQCVSPSAVQKAVQDIRGDDFTQRQIWRLEAGFHPQRVGGENRAHVGGLERKSKEGTEKRERGYSVSAPEALQQALICARPVSNELLMALPHSLPPCLPA